MEIETKGYNQSFDQVKQPALSIHRLKEGRLGSLDVFRGVTIAAMILVNCSYEETYGPLLHAKWNGWTLADTIFPCFLWIVGVSLALSVAARVRRGESRSALAKHALRRAALLFLCGVFVDGFPYFGSANIHVAGVLQKIAVCYLLAFPFSFSTTWKAPVIGIVSLNLLYLGPMSFYPVPGCGAGSWTLDCNFARFVDGLLPNGHKWWAQSWVPNPDGLVSMLPAASTILFGLLGGRILRGSLTPEGRTGVFTVQGVALALAGQLASAWIPINKPLWTPSYVLLMAGVASFSFGIWYWLIDVRGARRSWFKFFEIYGMNPIAAYMISRLGANFAKVHVFGRSIYGDICLRLASPPNASLLFALLHVFGVFLIVWWMHRRGWFLKF